MTESKAKTPMFEQFKLTKWNTRVKLEIFLLSLVLLVGMSAVGLFYRENLANLNQTIMQSHQIGGRLFERLIDSDSEGLGRALAGFANNQQLLDLFVTRDRGALYQTMQPLFAQIREQFNITHAYFIDPDGRVFLRAHKPAQYGDQLRRETYLQAAQSQMLACGIEMGKNFFSLRCVMPLFENKELIGYMEMAEEIDHLFAQMQQTTGNDFALLISQSFIQQSGANLQESPLGDFSILYQTAPALTSSLLANVQLKEGEDQPVLHRITQQGKMFSLGVVPFTDAKGQVPGVVIVIQEVTRLYANAKKEFWTNLLLIVLVGAAMVLLFVLSIKRAFSSLENELQLRTEKIKTMALQDSLTKLPNRAMFTKLVEQQISQSHRYKRTFSVFFMDLDGFKNVNDTLGHDAGDELLIQVAQRLRNCVRDSDIVARLGGDEFVALLPGDDERESDFDSVLVVARRIIATIATPYQVNSTEVRVTISIGIADYPSDGEDEVTLSKHADLAMYDAKQRGKNQIQRYCDDVHQKTFQRMALQTELMQALDDDQFELYFQAKVDLQQENAVGIEALIRWHHPKLGLILPKQFIGLAESSGLIVNIGKWVIRQACKQFMHWQVEDNLSLPIAVNVSPVQFNDANFYNFIVDVLSDTGMPADQLMLEITENALFQDIDQATDMLTRLRGLGVRIAIDDLGVGYASLGMLDTFPVDTLKIDQTFMDDLHNNASHRAVVEAIVLLGNKLGITVVAEGVETAEQLAFVTEQSCDQCQGYYFNLPMDAISFTEFLRQQE